MIQQCEVTGLMTSQSNTENLREVILFGSSGTPCDSWGVTVSGRREEWMNEYERGLNRAGIV